MDVDVGEAFIEGGEGNWRKDGRTLEAVDDAVTRCHRHPDDAPIAQQGAQGLFRERRRFALGGRRGGNLAEEIRGDAVDVGDTATEFDAIRRDCAFPKVAEGVGVDVGTTPPGGGLTGAVLERPCWRGHHRTQGNGLAWRRFGRVGDDGDDALILNDGRRRELGRTSASPETNDGPRTHAHQGGAGHSARC